MKPFRLAVISGASGAGAAAALFLAGGAHPVALGLIFAAMGANLWAGLVLSREGIQLKRITGVLNRLAVGDFESMPELPEEGAFKALRSEVEHMRAYLRQKAGFTYDIAQGKRDDALFVAAAEYDGIGRGLDAVIGANERLLREMVRLAEEGQAGHLSARADETLFEGHWKRMVRELNRFISEVEKPCLFILEYTGKMAKGEALPEIDNVFSGGFHDLVENLKSVRTELYALLEEAAMLTDKAKQGELSYRGNAGRLKGGYADIVTGVNDAIDAIIAPIHEANRVLREMEKGNLNVSVQGQYMGDHAQLKNTVNFMATTILGYIEEIAEVLKKMAGKDLTCRIDREYLGDFSELKESINFIARQFNDLMAEINTAAEQVAAGARQVADSSQNLSQGSTEQASSVEEITSSITQVAEQTKQNAGNANRANELSMNAKNMAEKGNARMEDMLLSMKDINASSENISRIIKVIDDIAFQTNILALNAAVEAARAGEHGKGFAVVAEEVRNLAARSADAAKETTDMIDDSIKKVHAGTRIANETAKALQEIVKGVAEAVDIVGEIAEASNEQAMAVAQVNEAIEQVSEVTQTNTATAEESASASEEMTSQAQVLNEMVASFRLASSGSLRRLTGPSGRLGTVSKPQGLPGGLAKVSIDLDEGDFGKY